jgi:hypothetical protein
MALLAGAVAASCTIAAGSGNPHEHGGTTAPKVTTTTFPSEFNIGIHTFDWTETGPGVFHVGPTGSSIPGRTLDTEIRYPTLAGSAGIETTNALPSHDGGPYPVIVFAHGFQTDPSSYEPLLDSWVEAGFVVVSPIFPDESSQAVAAAGGVTNQTIANTLESDVYNEPGDIVYVLKQVENLPKLTWGSHLNGVLDLSEVGLAGQSDGADVIAGLTFAPAFSSAYAALPVAPKAVAILSGQAWTDIGPDSKQAGTYSSGSSSPALLQVQSDADGCNTPAEATDLFSALQTGPEAKWFLTLLGADHLAPYEGASPWAPVVEKVTTDFFELELNWRASSLSQGSIPAAGDVSKTAQTTTSVNENTIPVVQTDPSCGIPT